MEPKHDLDIWGETINFAIKNELPVCLHLMNHSPGQIEGVITKYDGKAILFRPKKRGASYLPDDPICLDTIVRIEHLYV